MKSKLLFSFELSTDKLRHPSREPYESFFKGEGFVYKTIGSVQLTLAGNLPGFENFSVSRKNVTIEVRFLIRRLRARLTAMI